MRGQYKSLLKLPLPKLLSRTEVPVQIPAALLLIRLLATVPGKAAKEELSIGLWHAQGDMADLGS